MPLSVEPLDGALVAELVCEMDCGLSTDGEVPCGGRWSKTWQLRNTGCETWPSGTRLALYRGPALGASERSVGAVPAGGEAELCLEFTAPAGPELEAEFSATWGLRDAAATDNDADASWFGPPLELDVLVVPAVNGGACGGGDRGGDDDDDGAPVAAAAHWPLPAAAAHPKPAVAPEGSGTPPPDSRVELHGLSTVELNGRRGVVQPRPTGAVKPGRELVLIDGEAVPRSFPRGSVRAVADEAGVAAGSRVELRGLTKQELNGRRGTVSGKPGRELLLLDGETVPRSFRRDNMRPVRGGIAVGSRVELHGLKTAALNGRRGTVRPRPAAGLKAGRTLVLLDGDPAPRSFDRDAVRAVASSGVAPGSRVELHALKTAALNGRHGTVCNKPGRTLVLLDGDPTPRSFKPENVLLLRSAPGAAVGGGGGSSGGGSSGGGSSGGGIGGGGESCGGGSGAGSCAVAGQPGGAARRIAELEAELETERAQSRRQQEEMDALARRCRALETELAAATAERNQRRGRGGGHT